MSINAEVHAMRAIKEFTTLTKEEKGNLIKMAKLKKREVAVLQENQYCNTLEKNYKRNEITNETTGEKYATQTQAALALGTSPQNLSKLFAGENECLYRGNVLRRNVSSMSRTDFSKIKFLLEELSHILLMISCEENFSIELRRKISAFAKEVLKQ